MELDEKTGNDADAAMGATMSPVDDLVSELNKLKRKVQVSVVFKFEWHLCARDEKSKFPAHFRKILA